MIIVVACDGDVLPGPGQGRRLGELRASAAILGADKAVWLGYADSGHGPVLFEDPPGLTRFARADVGEAAAKLAAVLAGDRADLLLSYDARGVNGHRDHVRVHQVGVRAAELAGVRLVEATAPRELAVRAARLLLLFRLVKRYRLDEVRGYGTPRSQITHRIDVRPYAAQKRAALAAHRTPVSGSGRWPGRSAPCSDHPCRYSALPAARNGSPNPADGRASPPTAAPRTGLASQISAQLQLALTDNTQVSGLRQLYAELWPKSGQTIQDSQARKAGKAR